MSFASIPFGHGTFGGNLLIPGTSAPIGGAPEVQIVIDPYTIEIAGISMKGYQLIDSLSIDTALGRQGSARFSLYNIWFAPTPGQPVRITFYNEVIFVGSIGNVDISSNNQQTFVRYDCECVDNANLLYRVKAKLVYSNQSVFSIANNVILNTADGNGISVGTIDNNVIVPTANADGVSAFEFLSGIATATGTIFSIDEDRKLHFTGANIPAAPSVLNGNNVESCSLKFNLEGYLNWITTTVTGTPASSSTTDALSVELTRANDDQLIEREAIESAPGLITGVRYSEYVSIVHPSSNDPAELSKLCNAYNKIRLGLSWTPNRTLHIRTRQYGFKSGQSAVVDIPQLGVSGNWVIQRTSMREESGRFLIYDLELNQTSLIRRAQELWVEVVNKGTMTIVPPISLYTHTETRAATGAGTWQVPSGVTEIQVSVYAAGGGGGGGARSDWPAYGGVNTADGAAGGSGGLVVGVFSVTPLEILDYSIGTGGTPGPGQNRVESFLDSFGGNGTAGGETWVKKGGAYLVRSYGGDYGIGGTCTSRPLYTKTYPAGRSGGGIGGQVISVGGAANAGYGGPGFSYSVGGSGGNGKIIFEW